MIAVTEDLIRDMTDALVQEVHPEAVILFGSYARGDARSDSDIDLLVVETASFGPGRDRRKEMAHLWRVLAKFPISKDILVYSREELEHWRSANNHIIARALREGRFLYGSV